MMSTQTLPRSLRAPAFAYAHLFRATFLFAAALLVLPVLPATADTVTVNSQVLWTDAQSSTHAAREVRYEVWSGTTLRSSGRADASGAISSTFNFDSSMPTAFLRVFSDTPSGNVSSAGVLNSATTYSIQGSTFNASVGITTANLTVANSTTAGQAFSVADATYTDRKFLQSVRPAGPLPAFPILFPSGSGSFFDGTKIELLQLDRWDWDVTNHEYGHYITSQDRLDNSPGGNHSFGASNIAALGKSAGTRLAWGEGVATYLGLAAQNVDTTHPTMTNVGDTFYTDTEDSSINFNIEASNNSNVGEGDEAPVARILWDIADPANEPHDKVARGFSQVYSDLLAARDRRGPSASLENLNQLNDYYMNSNALPGDADRANIGTILEQYTVSPHPTGTLPGSTVNLSLGDQVTFNWTKQNNNASDTFELMLWNSDFSTRILNDFLIPGNVTSYTLTAAQRALLFPYIGQSLNFSILGSDMFSPTNVAYTGIEMTGPYWSGAYSFAVTGVPEPTSLAFVGIAMIGGTFLTPRRRGSCARVS